MRNGMSFEVKRCDIASVPDKRRKSSMYAEILSNIGPGEAIEIDCAEGTRTESVRCTLYAKARELNIPIQFRVRGRKVFVFREAEVARPCEQAPRSVISHLVSKRRATR